MRKVLEVLLLAPFAETQDRVEEWACNVGRGQARKSEPQIGIIAWYISCFLLSHICPSVRFIHRPCKWNHSGIVSFAILQMQ